MVSDRQAALKVLGLSEWASDDEIRLAYQKMSIVWHPDNNHNSNEATHMMQQLNTAKDQLQEAVKDDESYEEYEDYDEGESDYDEDYGADEVYDDPFSGGTMNFGVFLRMYARMQEAGMIDKEGAFIRPSGPRRTSGRVGEICYCPECNARRRMQKGQDREAKRGQARQRRLEREAEEAAERAQEEVDKKVQQTNPKSSLAWQRGGESREKLIREHFLQQAPCLTLYSIGETSIILVLDVDDLSLQENRKLPPKGVEWEVAYSLQGDKKWTQVLAPKDYDKVNIRCLLPGTQYCFKVRTGLAGSHTWSGSPDWYAWGPVQRFTTQGEAQQTSKASKSGGGARKKKKNRDATFASLYRQSEVQPEPEEQGWDGEGAANAKELEQQQADDQPEGRQAFAAQQSVMQQDQQDDVKQSDSRLQDASSRQQQEASAATAAAGDTDQQEGAADSAGTASSSSNSAERGSHYTADEAGEVDASGLSDKRFASLTATITAAARPQSFAAGTPPTTLSQAASTEAALSSRWKAAGGAAAQDAVPANVPSVPGTGDGSAPASAAAIYAANKADIKALDALLGQSSGAPALAVAKAVGQVAQCILARPTPVQYQQPSIDGSYLKPISMTAYDVEANGYAKWFRHMRANNRSARLNPDELELQLQQVIFADGDSSAGGGQYRWDQQGAKAQWQQQQHPAAGSWNGRSSSSKVQQQQQGGSKYKTVPCRWWAMGSCRFGVSCMFRHDEQATAAVAVEPPRSITTLQLAADNGWGRSEPSSSNGCSSRGSQAGTAASDSFTAQLAAGQNYNYQQQQPMAPSPTTMQQQQQQEPVAQQPQPPAMHYYHHHQEQQQQQADVPPPPPIVPQQDTSMPPLPQKVVQQQQQQPGYQPYQLVQQYDPVQQPYNPMQHYNPLQAAYAPLQAQHVYQQQPPPSVSMPYRPF